MQYKKATVCETPNDEAHSYSDAMIMKAKLIQTKYKVLCVARKAFATRRPSRC